MLNTHRPKSSQMRTGTSHTFLDDDSEIYFFLIQIAYLTEKISMLSIVKFFLNLFKIGHNFMPMVGLLISFHANADFQFAVDFMTTQDSLATPTTSSRSQMYYDAAILLSTSAKMQYFLGGWYSGYSTSENNAGTTTTFSTQDYFIGGKAYIGSHKRLSVTAGYSLLSNATYKSGSSASELWQGNATIFKTSYQFELTEKINLAISLCYYGATYSKKDVSSTTSSFSGTKSFILPLMGINFSF